MSLLHAQRLMRLSIWGGAVALHDSNIATDCTSDA